LKFTTIANFTVIPGYQTCCSYRPPEIDLEGGSEWACSNNARHTPCETEEIGVVALNITTNEKPIILKGISLSKTEIMQSYMAMDRY